MNYLKKSELKLEEFLESSKKFLFEKYKVKRETFSYANPTGHVILVVKNISRLVFFYIKDSSNQLNFKTANRINSVHGLAQLQGHNAFRGSGSKLSVLFNIRPEFNSSLIKDGKIFIPDNIKLECVENGLVYSLNINKEFEIINLFNFSKMKFPLVQGKFSTKSFVGSGEDIQTYSVTISPNELIDNDIVYVQVNGSKYKKYESLHGSLFMDKLVLIKTGLTSGFDIIFGKANSHTIPSRGEKIEIKYLIHEGKKGDIEKPTLNFLDTAYDGLGNTVNLNEIFYCTPELNGAYFGSQPEPIELTKLLAPNVLTNAIIHDKKSLLYSLNYMNLFSNVKASRINSTWNIILYPKLEEKLVSGQDYFDMDVNRMLLSTNEKFRILEKLKENQSSSIEIVIVNPKLTRFGVNIIVEVFGRDFVIEETIKNDIRNFLSGYMMSLQRLNKIPHSDLVRNIDKISSVDSVNLEFITESTTHLDNLGNLLLPDSDIAVLRGDFIDHNGNTVEDSFDKDSSYSFVNIDIRYVS